MVATYEQVSGDLVIVDATNPSGLAMKIVDGLPDGATATGDETTPARMWTPSRSTSLRALVRPSSGLLLPLS